MKQTTTPTTGSNHDVMIPLTQEGVKSRLSAFNGSRTPTTGQPGKSPKVESALRNATIDVQEARARHELKKINSSAQPTAAELQRRQVLETELEGVKALRKIDKIVNLVAEADAVREAANRKFKSAENAFNEIKAKAEPIEAKISHIHAVNDALLKIANLEDEERWLRQLMNDGDWRRTSRDFQEAALAEKLSGMASQGKFHGETTEQGAYDRIEAIEHEIATLKQLHESDFNSEESFDLYGLTCQLQEINEEIARTSPIFENIRATAQANEERFSEMLEVGLIAANGAVEVYLITAEADATPLPG